MNVNNNNINNNNVYNNNDNTMNSKWFKGFVINQYEEFSLDQVAWDHFWCELALYK